MGPGRSVAAAVVVVEGLPVASAVPHLLAPGRIGTLTVPNRILFPPISTRLTGPDGPISAREVAYLAARARGGAGLVVSGPMLVATDHEPPSGLMPRIDADAHIPAVRRLADAVHQAGGLLSVQLSPGTGRLGPAEPGAAAPVSASATPWVRDPQLRCRPLTTGELEALVVRFGQAAGRLAAAGVDVIDVHGHSGYLVDQLLTGLWNHRTDAYGGSVAGRARFAVELVQAARAAAPGLPVTFRLTTAHHLPGGREIEESVEIARLLAAAGVDLLLVEEGGPAAPAVMAPPTYLRAGLHLAGAARVAAAVAIPVAVAGAMTVELAEQAIASGQVAFVGLGRALVADPDLPRALADGRADRIRPCVRCNACFDVLRAGGPLACAVNPMVGSEAAIRVERAERARRVVVVGAGPAGLEAARVAALRGHQVDLYEQADGLGGVLADAARPPFKRELAGLVTWYAGRIAELGVTVHLGRRLDRGSPALANADVVVVATGGDPRAMVTGAARDDVVGVLEMHAGAAVGRRVVVAGGGAAGADAALDLALRGHEVTVVEEQPTMLPGRPTVNGGALLARLEQSDVALRTGTTVVGKHDDGVHVHGPHGPEVIAADSLVIALGTRASTELVAAGNLEDPRVHLVGDCLQPAGVAEAVHGGFWVGLRV